MAQKRMFTMKIVDSDVFLDMPLSTQCLYFHLNMRADDDGFIGNPKKIMRMIGASEDDLKILLAKKFLIIFENNIVVIKHWWMHNTLAKDRYHETSYIDEKELLKIKENRSYSLTNGIPIKSVNNSDNGMLTECKQNVNGMLTECITNCKQNDNADLDIVLDIDKGLNTTISQGQQNYAKQVYELWKTAGLPCSKDLLYFTQKEFKTALEHVRGINSNDVLAACKNYISVLNDDTCYISNKYWFDSFVESKTFRDYLPNYFDIAKFKYFKNKEVQKNNYTQKCSNPDKQEYMNNPELWLKGD